MIILTFFGGGGGLRSCPLLGSVAISCSLTDFFWSTSDKTTKKWWHFSHFTKRVEAIYIQKNTYYFAIINSFWSKILTNKCFDIGTWVATFWTAKVVIFASSLGTSTFVFVPRWGQRFWGYIGASCLAEQDTWCDIP